jgi:hypothetical protein
MVFLMPDLPLEMQLSVQMSGETIANRLLTHSAQSGVLVVFGVLPSSDREHLFRNCQA